MIQYFQVHNFNSILGSLGSKYLPTKIQTHFSDSSAGVIYEFLR